MRLLNGGGWSRPSPPSLSPWLGSGAIPGVPVPCTLSPCCAIPPLSPCHPRCPRAVPAGPWTPGQLSFPPAAARARPFSCRGTGDALKFLGCHLCYANPPVRGLRADPLPAAAMELLLSRSAFQRHIRRSGNIALLLPPPWHPPLCSARAGPGNEERTGQLWAPGGDGCPMRSPRVPRVPGLLGVPRCPRRDTESGPGLRHSGAVLCCARVGCEHGTSGD